MESVLGGNKWCSLLLGGTLGIVAGLSAPATLGSSIGIALSAGVIAELICSGWEDSPSSEGSRSGVR